MSPSINGIRLALSLALLLPVPALAQSVQLVEVASGFDRPVSIAAPGDGSGRLFVVERGGLVLVVEQGQVLAEPFLDLSARVYDQYSEQGLLGPAFDPGFTVNGYLYVYFTAATDAGLGVLDGDSVLERYTVSAGNPAVADPASARVVLTVAQPYTNHNGGQVAFGPDGYLYLALGDGGGGGDPGDNAQHPTTLLGSILRLDVSGDDFPGDATRNYSVPPDNPFVGSAAGADEVWAWGLRNPWRFSFDRCSGDMYIADVGQNSWEEVNLEPFASNGGVNYGWNLCEGLHPYGGSGAVCDTTADGLQPPILEYGHGDFDSYVCSVTGGFRYRGNSEPALADRYLFGDFCAGYIWGATEQAGTWSFTELAQAGFQLTAFGEDEQGELYVLAYNPGALYRIEDLDGIFGDGFECGAGAWQAVP